MLHTLGQLNEIAKGRGQSLAQMALAWVLNDSRVSSVIVGASSVEQLKANIQSIRKFYLMIVLLVFGRCLCRDTLMILSITYAKVVA